MLRTVAPLFTYYVSSFSFFSFCNDFFFVFIGDGILQGEDLLLDITLVVTTRLGGDPGLLLLIGELD